MKKNGWAYTLDILYADYPTESRDKPRVRMYFSDLADAFERLLTIHPNYYRQGIWEAARADLPLTDLSFSEVRISTIKGEQLLTAKLINDPDIAAEVKTKGLYYFFAGGIQNFEKRSGILLSDFKDYAPTAPHLLVSYLAPDDYSGFKDSRGYRNRVDALEGRVTPGLQFNVTYNYKHFDTNRTVREPSAAIFQEMFYFSNAEDALKKLLQTDFRMLKEDIAWDNDLSSFYCRADVVNGYSRMASVFATITPDRRYGDVSCKEPGAYLECESSLKDFEILKKLTTLKVPHQWSWGSAFHLATLDAKTSTFQNRPEFDKLMAGLVNAEKGKTVKPTTPLETKQIKKKRHGL